MKYLVTFLRNNQIINKSAVLPEDLPSYLKTLAANETFDNTTVLNVKRIEK